MATPNDDAAALPEVSELLAVDRREDFELGTEDRFPLDLTSSRSQLWTAYEAALTEAWDPEDDKLWAGFDPVGFSSAECEAGALVWSHRAWVDHGAMVESAAVLVRACLEPAMSADFKYCLGMRAVERARSVDMSRMVAERLDQYHSRPASHELERLLNDDLVRRALHEKTTLGAYVAAHLVAQATLDLRSWERTRLTVHEGLGVLADLVVRDKARMVEVAWTQLAEMALAAEREAREAMAANTAYVMFSEEGRGRQLPALLSSPAAGQLVAAHEIAATAGLGGLCAQSQQEIFDDVIVELSDKMADLGIVLQAPAGLSNGG